MSINKVNFKGKLQKDNLFVKSELKSVNELTGMKVRQRYANCVISEGEIVNFVSGSYGHLPNENFFYSAEEALISADIQYETRTINRANRSFVADYILSDDRYSINVKSGSDRIRPMLRFTNSYDSSCKTSGQFGLFRELCSNGLHVANTQVGFSLMHTGTIDAIVMPKIMTLIESFMDNEFYSLHKKLEVLAEKPITNIKDFVEMTAKETKLFTFSASEKNPTDPSANARFVMDIIERESNELNVKPNFWLGYNAFNELLHGKLKKTFDKQMELDSQLFNTVLEMAN